MTTPILTLKELKALESEASAMDYKAVRSRSMEQSLAAIRTGDKPLMVAYKSWLPDDVKSAIEGIINEHGADLLRIVEMRQAAFARQCKVAAAEKRAQLATVVAPEPEAAGATS
jgi:hypothetical protein